MPVNLSFQGGQRTFGRPVPSTLKCKSLSLLSVGWVGSDVFLVGGVDCRRSSIRMYLSLPLTPPVPLFSLSLAFLCTKQVNVRFYGLHV